MVINDPAIAESLGQLKAEWKSLTGGLLEITEATADEIRDADPLDSDALIFPSVLLGSFAERRQLNSVPRAALENAEYAWQEVFDALAQHECSWGGETLAVPLGSPVFTLMYRADLLEKHGKRPPKSWDEYQKIVELMSAPGDGAEALRTIEPLAPGWASRVLLARAAGYVRHRDNFSSLFRIDTMEPLIAGPPFVRALEELVAAAKTAGVDTISMTPAKARRELLSGRAAMAITWASHAGGSDEKSELPEEAIVSFAELPGSHLAFNISTQTWEKRESTETDEVPLISIAGRLAAVSRSTDYPEGATRLICWLSGPAWSTSISARSEATTLFRTSQLKSSEEWVDANLGREAAVRYGETVQQALVRTNCLSVLRIPGQAEYLAALDTAVTAAVKDGARPEDALKEAATTWTEITKRYGAERQRTAYQHSLGLTP